MSWRPKCGPLFRDFAKNSGGQRILAPGVHQRMCSKELHKNAQHLWRKRMLDAALHGRGPMKDIIEPLSRREVVASSRANLLRYSPQWREAKKAIAQNKQQKKVQAVMSKHFPFLNP